MNCSIASTAVTGPTAVGAAGQGDIGVLIDMVGNVSMGPGVATWPTGPLLGTVGDLLGFASPERGGLAGRGPLLLVELVLELPILVQEFLDPLLQGSDSRSQRLVLVPKLLPVSPAQQQPCSAPPARSATWSILASKGHAAKHVRLHLEENGWRPGEGLPITHLIEQRTIEWRTPEVGSGRPPPLPPFARGGKAACQPAQSRPERFA